MLILLRGRNMMGKIFFFKNWAVHCHHFIFPLFLRLVSTSINIATNFHLIQSPAPLPRVLLHTLLSRRLTSVSISLSKTRQVLPWIRGTDYATSPFLRLPSGNAETSVRPTVSLHSRRPCLHFYLCTCESETNGGRTSLRIHLTSDLAVVCVLCLNCSSSLGVGLVEFREIRPCFSRFPACRMSD